jgi:hypothetical protein
VTVCRDRQQSAGGSSASICPCREDRRFTKTACAALSAGTLDSREGR